MKTTALIFTLFCALTAGAQVEWENPTVIDRGKEAPHAWFKTSSTKSLNGLWRFHYADKISDAPTDFYQSGFDDSHWVSLPVPSNWEMHGHGAPFYANIEYMWSPNPPHIDIDIPVGTYRTTFTVPAGWENKEVLLHFGSITGYARVYVNGSEVGMTKCSKTPAEFDVTKYLKPASDNLLAVQVYRWHDGSYMEDQDFFRLTGIERDVYLQAYPKQCLWDYSVQATPVHNYRDGQFDAAFFIRSFDGGKPEGKLGVTLTDPAGRNVLKEKINVSGNEVAVSKTIKNVRLWSAETPNLYTLTMVYNGDTITDHVGFREVKIENARLLVNGHVVYIKGVNHHETNDSLGHVPSVDIMMWDLKKLKELNFNAVRCSHYPNDPRWLQLCDKYGIYVVDEANIETHGMGSCVYFTDTVPHPAYRPEWAPAHRDRIGRMFYRDRNHPSIIGWSLGNECGNGEVFKEQYKWLKEHDKTRFVQFEQAWEDWNTDIVCHMYPNWGRIKNYAKSGKTRPFIMCEYAHAQGNSLGNFQDFWDLIKASPNLQGGFIWDFQDQAIKRTINEGTDHRTYYMYNGGMGSYTWPQEENSGCDGVLGPDGNYKPHSLEVKKVYQDIVFPDFDWDKGVLTVCNEYNFISLDGFRFTWTLLRNGREVADGTFTAKAAPESRTTARIPLPEMDGEGEYALIVRALTSEACDLLPEGYCRADEQFIKPRPEGAKPIVAPGTEANGNVADVEVSEDANNVYFKVNGIEGSISKRTGLISKYGDKDYKPFAKYKFPEPFFWRAPNDNDMGFRMGDKSNVWRSAQYNTWVKSVTVGEKTDRGVAIDVAMELKDLNHQPYDIQYLIQPDGNIKIRAHIDTRGKKLPEMPRFGMRWTLDKGYEDVNYYGRGPWENYCDRKSSQFLGEYHTTATDLYFPYMRPQQTGHRCDVRWFDVIDAKARKRFCVSAADARQPIGMQVLHYCDEDLDCGNTKKMLHTKDVLPRRDVFVVVDAVQRGVGGDNSWGEPPHIEYRYFDGVYTLEFVFGVQDM